MKSNSILLIIGMSITFGLLVPLDYHASRIIHVNELTGEQIYSFEVIANNQMLQFILIGMIFGIYLSSWTVRVNEIKLKRAVKTD